MDSNLLKLIPAFEGETAEMLRIFLERGGRESLEEKLEAGLPRRGYLPGRPRIVYKFHGIGLRLRLGSRKIDFDFGFDGRTGGFNDWWLWLFAQDRPGQFPEFRDKEYIEAALEEARQAGEIGQPFQDRYDWLMYRLSSAPAPST
jgi:hypothetical protein